MHNEYIGGIALVGDPGAGKSSIAAELERQLDWQYLSFASGLKMDVAAMLATGTTVSWMDYMGDMENPDYKDRYRPLLQAYGSLRRREDPYYWVDRLVKAMDAGPDDTKYVIDDCRYQNEYETLRARGFKFVYLQRGPTTRALPAAEAVHESEQDWRRFPVEINLTYEAGPERQARRIINMLRLDPAIDYDLVEEVRKAASSSFHSVDDYFHSPLISSTTAATTTEDYDAAVKGLAGAVAKTCLCKPAGFCDCGPDDTMDESLTRNDTWSELYRLDKEYKAMSDRIAALLGELRNSEAAVPV